MMMTSLVLLAMASCTLDSARLCNPQVIAQIDEMISTMQTQENADLLLYADSIFHTSVSARYARGISRSAIEILDYHSQRGGVLENMKFLDQHLILIDSITSDSIKPSLDRSIGIALLDFMRYEEALERISKHEEYYREQGRMDIYYRSTALVYLEVGLFDEAATRTRSALSIDSLRQDRMSQSISKFNLACIRVAQDRKDEAFTLYHECLSSLGDNEMKGLASNVHIAIAKHYYKKRMYDESLDETLASILDAEAFGEFSAQAGGLALLGALHLANEEPDMALMHFETSERLYKSIGDTLQSVRLYEDMCLAYANMGEPHKALRYNKRALVLELEIELSEAKNKAAIALLESEHGNQHLLSEYNTLTRSNSSAKL